ncbi:MAG: BMP family ABC transporter substrate-binding protein [Lachnospiraceae bacterium]|jgi:basic membrane protein A|nr:BMP family ABC transporter substrate-binding protein [Lachnospiraceae bacterium]
MKKKVLLFLMALTMVISLAACGKKEEPAAPEAGTEGAAQEKEAAEAEEDTAQAEEKVEIKKIVTVLPNVRGDGGTHDLACRASESIAESIGAELDIVELGTAVTDSAKWEAAMCDLCEAGYDLIITGGSLMKDTIQTVAPMYPEMPFICYDVLLDFDTTDMENVYSMDFYQNEAAYMAGIIAANMTESNYVGFVGATKIPVIYDFMVGFIAGAQEVNPDIKVAVAFTNDFNDATLAKELALAQITDGADVLYPACGNAAAGVYEAARDREVYAVGNDQDVAAKYAQSDESIQKVILASVMKKVDNAVSSAYERYAAGELPFGTQETVGVAIDGAGVVKNDYYEEQLPDEVKKTVEEYEQKIKDGAVKVPTALGMEPEEIDEVINSAQ